jgi:dipeptidyl aminopeptidase/acylaminoacyl peptidase
MKQLMILATACAAIAAFGAPAMTAQTGGRRLLTLDDLAALREVSDPQISPDGAWVAYAVRTHDVKEDKRVTDIWMTSWDGARTLRVTASKESESKPRWSPDNQHLAFLSSRSVENEADQLWVMNRAGGEAAQATDLKGSVTDYAWSPDGKRLVLVVKDPDPNAVDDKDKDKKKTPKPIVIDRFQFKEDETGYLGARRQHLYLLDLASQKIQELTAGAFDEQLPAWSPDGSAIAFVTKRGTDPDRSDNFDVYVVEAKAGAALRQVTTYEGADCDPTWGSSPAWSPDGKSIAYLQGSDPKLIYYGVHQLAVIPSTGGTPRLLAPTLDRNVAEPRWSADGAWVYFLLEDNRTSLPARVRSAGGPEERIFDGRREVSDYDLGPGAKLAVLSGSSSEPFEVYALEGRNLRPLTRANQELMTTLRLGAVEEIDFKSKDGTKIHGFLVKPPDYQPGRRYPTILRIHGGPVSQFTSELMFEWQFFAANGYVVVAANPRGSSGLGEAFSKAIYAEWGNKDAQDVLAAVDYAVAQGIADPARLGVGGWSYGGMLTNYTIAQDTRFKAAVSGASISNALAGYGTDQYIREYEAELGPPWKNPEAWMRVSFPFLHADRIVTPTLFLCGEKDFNVPLLNSEQMYQALRSLGRETQLVIYPGEFHEIAKPSYLRDRLERYLAWYNKYLVPGAETGGSVKTGADARPR